MGYKLVAAVGRDKPNRPSDVAQVADLLARVPAADRGGGGAPAAGDTAALIAAIERFQTANLRALGLKKADGAVDRSGATLSLLYAKAAAVAKTVGWALPAASRHMQADYRWWLVNLNHTSSLEYTFWYRGCALSAVASMLAGCGIRLTDVKEVERIANKKHEAANVHLPEPSVKGRTLHPHGITDWAAVNPLTLDAWMTHGGSQGYRSSVSAELDWQKAVSVSARITFEAWLTLTDRRFPSPALLRTWLDASKRVIGNVDGGDHFVVLTGYEGETRFLAFDVGHSVDPRYPDNYSGGDTYFDFDKFVLFVTYTMAP